MKWFYWIFCIFFMVGYAVRTDFFKNFPEKKGEQIAYAVATTIAAPVVTPFIMGYELGDYRHRLDSLATVQNCNIIEEDIEEDINLE